MTSGSSTVVEHTSSVCGTTNNPKIEGLNPAGSGREKITKKAKIKH